jgi:hypothetical protein
MNHLFVGENLGTNLTAQTERDLPYVLWRGDVIDVYNSWPILQGTAQVLSVVSESQAGYIRRTQSTTFARS